MKKTFCFLTLLLTLTSCGNERMPVNEALSLGRGISISTNAPGFNQVKQIFSAKCSMCHNGATHPKDWTLYETSKNNLRALNDRLFIKADMPATGSLSSAEKSILKAWIDAGGPLEGLSGANDPTPTPEPTPTPGPTPTPAPSPEPLPDTNLKIVGFDQVKPIFNAKCSMCHNGNMHPKIWTNYETSKKDLQKLNDRLFVKADMPAAGSLTNLEKSKIKAWIVAGGPLQSVGASTPLPTPTPPRPTPNPGPAPVPTPNGSVSFDQVKPIFAAKCSLCHNGSMHPKIWTNYETSRNNLSALNNRLFVKGDMPATGSLSASEKSIIKAWINAGGPLKNGNTPPPNPPRPNPNPNPNPPEPNPIPQPDPNKIVGFDQVKPIFEIKCSMCHNGSMHPKIWTHYETSKNNLTVLNNRLFVKGDMPAAGSLTKNEKAVIKAWINAGGPLKGETRPTPDPDPAPAPAPEPDPEPIPVPSPNEEGKILVQNKCLSCHGSAMAALDTPLLHGQQKSYLIKQLKDFKSGERTDWIMGAMKSVVATLTDKEIESIASYLSLESECSVHINIDPGKGNVKIGEAKSSTCLGCHTAIAPVLNGQKTGYLKTTLNNFKNDKRKNDMMGPMAKVLTDDDINDLAAYFNSKRKCN